MRPTEVRDLVKGFILPRVGGDNPNGSLVNGSTATASASASTITLNHAEMNQLRLAFTNVAPARTLFRNNSGQANKGLSPGGSGEDRLGAVTEKMEGVGLERSRSPLERGTVKY